MYDGLQEWAAVAGAPQRVALVLLLERVGEAAVADADMDAHLQRPGDRRHLIQQRLREPLREWSSCIKERSRVSAKKRQSMASF